MRYPDPMQSPFAPSFIAAFRAASVLLKVMRDKLSVLSHLLLRMWPLWAHALTAAVIYVLLPLLFDLTYFILISRS